MPLYLTYDNQSLQDGIGAQALRIIGIYSVAKFFRIKYLHSPIIEVIEEFAHNFHSANSDKALVDEANEFFLFPSSRFDSKKSTRRVKLNSLSIQQLILYSIKYGASRSNVVLEILFPFSILDRLPLIYYLGARRLRKRHSSLLSKLPKPQVVAHVRWGYGWKYANQKFVRNRHLPFSYFSEIIPVIQGRFLGDESCTVLVHTDLSQSNKSWQPTQERVLQQTVEVSNLDSGQRIKIEGYNLEELIIFPKSCSYRIAYCAPFFETFLDMCRADILIMGTSAFSYLAGLINANSVIWPSTHGHGRFPGWTSSIELGINVRKEDMLRG